MDQALRSAHLDDWVASLPDGLDTLVGEDGNRLSGGQRQRLTLARALLSDAPVLDPRRADSAPRPGDCPRGRRRRVDAAGSRTVLLITHRPEGLDLVDEVVTLAEGSRVPER